MTTTSPWQVPAGHPPLGEDEVHVWRGLLRVPASCLEDLRRSLSADEIARAERFRLPKLHDQFIVARGTLRTLLGRYLGIDPAETAFVYGPIGKPALADRTHKTPIHFNLSHSGDVALYAFSAGREVGVDVECHRSLAKVEGIANRFFSPRECAMLWALPDDQRLEAFFRFWTVKEAYLKARGKGLSVPLSQVEVSFPPDGSPVIRDSSGSGDWSCRELPHESPYTAAVVVQGYDWRPLCWQS
jgi:4'-phosphopantetheinyl transferase